MNATVRVQHIHNRQLVALADFEIHFVVRRRYFQNTGPEFRIDRFVADDRNFLPCQRAPRLPPDQILVTLVPGMHRHTRVGHDRLGPGRGHFQKSARLVHNLVTNVIEAPLLRPRDDFLVGKRGLRGWIPVDHAASAIDQSLAIKIDKDALHRAHVVLIKGIALARPVTRATQPFQLLNNDPAVLVLPFHHALEKFFPAEIAPPYLFRSPEKFLDRRLGGYAGVIDARQPQDFVTLHASAPRQDVLNRGVEDMPQGQDARDVRRRNDDGESGLGRTRIRLKIVALEPSLVPFRFNRAGIVCLRELGHGAWNHPETEPDCKL